MKIMDKFNFYGRRRGKKLSRTQTKFVEEYLPKISLSGISYEENPNRNKIQIEGIFGEECPVWIEIGFGGGEHLISVAKKNRHVGIIGCEPYLNGVAMFLPKLAKEKLHKVRVFMDDARLLCEVLPNFSISKLFLLFPDPWPKKRHARRRFINKQNIDMFKRILKRGALIYISTDVNSYVRHVLEIFTGDSDFEWEVRCASDWRNPWKDWENTRYFSKAAIAGRKTTFLVFKRV